MKGNTVQFVYKRVTNQTNVAQNTSVLTVKPSKSIIVACALFAPSTKPTTPNDAPQVSCLAIDEQTIMQTAVVTVINGQKRTRARLMVDNGASCTYIATKLAHTLGLCTLEKQTILVKTFNDNTVRSVQTTMVQFEIETSYGTQVKIQAHSLDVISKDLYPSVYNIKEFHTEGVYSSYLLAPSNSEMEVEILSGSDYIMDFNLSQPRLHIADHVYLCNTIVGWVLAGCYQLANTFMSDPVLSFLK